MEPEPEKETREEEAPEVDTPFVKLERTVGGLTAAVDQVAAAQRTSDGLMLAFAFAVGVLAAMIALQHRELKGLRDAFPG